VGQVLIEVHAAGINPFDAKLSLGYLKEGIPLQFPYRLGGDLAGVIVELGQGVEEFKIGDEVYGQANALTGASGSMADFAVANSGEIALKPEKETMIESGTLPLVGVSAIQALIENMNVQSGQKILIHGGAGGIGSTAIQLAKSLGAYVATTVGTKDVEFVKKLGADEVIDYKTQKFEELLKDFDAVYDTVGGETADKSLDVLKSGGMIVSMLKQEESEKLKKKNIKAVYLHTMVTTERLQKLAGIVDSGKIKIQIDKVFPLNQAKDAFAYQEESHPRGKVVLSIKE
jgi:alcohol dehydrogenase